MNLDIDFTPLKINSKWIIGLHIKHKTIKLPDNNIGESLGYLGYGSDFQIQLQRYNPQQKILLSWASFKNSALQTQCHEMKREATDWEKILAKDIPDKGLLPKMYKEILKLNNKNTT